MSVSACFMSGGRSWTQEELNFFSDVIATGTVVESREVQEEPEMNGRVETTFLISESFKGPIPQNAKVVVRHPALPDTGAPSDGISSNKYLLYLQKDNHNTFVPTSGKAVVSIRLDVAKPADVSRF